MFSHGMFPSGAIQQNPINLDLPEHLAKDGMSQTMGHYEPTLTVLQPIISGIILHCFRHHLGFFLEQSKLPNLLTIWVQPKEEAPPASALPGTPPACTLCEGSPRHSHWLIAPQNHLSQKSVWMEPGRRMCVRVVSIPYWPALVRDKQSFWLIAPQAAFMYGLNAVAWWNHSTLPNSLIPEICTEY